MQWLANETRYTEVAYSGFEPRSIIQPIDELSDYFVVLFLLIFISIRQSNPYETSIRKKHGQEVNEVHEKVLKSC